MVELALLSPFVFFLFVGSLDWGFYAHALLSTQNAARIAAVATAATFSETGTPSQSFACQYAREEMSRLPNSKVFPADCGSLPLRVSAIAVTDDEGGHAVQVSVTYETLPLIPIPGLLPGKLAITRTAQVRAYGG